MIKKVIVLMTASIFSFSTFVSAKNTQSEEINQISGIECTNSRPSSSYGYVNFTAGAYMDNYGHYLYVQFNGTKEIIVKVFQRKSFITSYGGLADDKLLFEYIHKLDDLVSYTEGEKLFDFDYHIESSVYISFRKSLRFFERSHSKKQNLNTISCFFTRESSQLFKLYLDNKINSSYAYNNRTNNQYLLKDFDDHWDLYHQEKAYEDSLLKKN